MPWQALRQNTQNRQNLLQLGQGPVLTTVMVLSTVLSTVLVPPWTCEQRPAPVAVDQAALPCTSSSGLPAQVVWPVVVTPAVVTSAVVVVVTAVVTPAVVVVVTPVLYLASGSALVVVLRGEAHDSRSMVRVAASEAPWLQDHAP